jgi:hypothetical protein
MRKKHHSNYFYASHIDLPIEFGEKNTKTLSILLSFHPKIYKSTFFVYGDKYYISLDIHPEYYAPIRLIVNELEWKIDELCEKRSS